MCINILYQKDISLYSNSYVAAAPLTKEKKYSHED